MTTILTQQCHIKITVFWASMLAKFRSAIAILSDLSAFLAYIAMMLPLLLYLCARRRLEKWCQELVNGFILLWRLG